MLCKHPTADTPRCGRLPKEQSRTGVCMATLLQTTCGVFGQPRDATRCHTMSEFRPGLLSSGTGAAWVLPANHENERQTFRNDNEFSARCDLDGESSRRMDDESKLWWRVSLFGSHVFNGNSVFGAVCGRMGEGEIPQCLDDRSLHHAA